MNLLDVQKVLDAMKIGVKKVNQRESYAIHTDKGLCLSLFFRNGTYVGYHIKSTPDNEVAKELDSVILELKKSEKN